MDKYLTNQGTANYLSNVYNIPLKTVEMWVTKIHHEKDISINNNQLKGRKKEIDIEYKERYKILKKYQTFRKAQRKKK